MVDIFEPIYAVVTFYQIALVERDVVQWKIKNVHFILTKNKWQN